MASTSTSSRLPAPNQNQNQNPAKKKATTKSILDQYLLGSTLLADTISEDDIRKAIRNARTRSFLSGGGGRGGRKGKGKARRDDGDDFEKVLLPYIQSQRSKIRSQVSRNVLEFSTQQRRENISRVGGRGSSSTRKGGAGEDDDDDDAEAMEVEDEVQDEGSSGMRPEDDLEAYVRGYEMSMGIGRYEYLSAGEVVRRLREAEDALDLELAGMERRLKEVTRGIESRAEGIVNAAMGLREEGGGGGGEGDEELVREVERSTRDLHGACSSVVTTLQLDT